ncbi:MAG: IS66 family transposase [Holophagales bacterium]|nr:IS66 family transposase [Holophagales bacterium]
MRAGGEDIERPDGRGSFSDRAAEPAGIDQRAAACHGGRARILAPEIARIAAGDRQAQAPRRLALPKAVRQELGEGRPVPAGPGLRAAGRGGRGGRCGGCEGSRRGRPGGDGLRRAAGPGQEEGHGRGALPANLPRRRVVIEVPAQERACSCCQREMTPFGEDVKLTLDYEPARITVVETVRVKYSCSKCHEGVVIAPVPDAVMDKGLPEAGMLAYVAVSKYADHLPLYRLERVMARSGLVISRNTLGDWIDFIADSFSSVIEAMKKKILKGPIVQSDDTKVRVLGGPEGSYAGYLWCYGGLHDEVVFDFTEGRGREGPQRFLDGYQGYLQVDAYAGYDVVFARGKVLEVACWAHVRRKIFEARTTDPKRADPLLGMIAALYAVEAEAKGLTADEREALRTRGHDHFWRESTNGCFRHGPTCYRRARWVRRSPTP